MRAPDLPESPHKGQRGLQRLLNALFYSLSGLRLAFYHESAFRQEVGLAAVLIPLACIVDVSAAERAMLFGSVLLVLLVELLNSSVEAAVDRIGFDTHRLSKRAKDLGSAAVLIALVMLATTWGLIAIPSLIQFGQGLFSSPHKAATADVVWPGGFMQRFVSASESWHGGPRGGQKHPWRGPP